MSKRLDQIFANTERILADMQQLRVDVKEIVRGEFRISFERQLEAHRKNLDDIIAGLPSRKPVSAASRKRLGGLVSDLRLELYTTYQYGFATFPFVVSGYTSLRSAMQLAGIDAGEVESTGSLIFKEFFLPLTNPNEKGSFAWALGQANDRSAALLTRIQQDTRSGTVGITGNVCSGTPDPCMMTAYTTTISGDAANPSSFIHGPVDPTVGGPTPGGIQYTMLTYPLAQNPNLLQPRAFYVMDGKPMAMRKIEADLGADDAVTALRSLSQEYVAERSRIASLQIALKCVRDLFSDRFPN